MCSAADATLIRCTALIRKRDNCLQKGHIIAAVWNGVAHFKTVSHFVSLSPSPPLSLTFQSRALSLSLNPQSHLTSSHQRKGQQEQEHIRGDFQWDASSRRITVRWWWRLSQIKEGTPNLFQHQSKINYINYALCLLFIRETLIIIASRVLAYTIHLFACH